MNNRILGLVAVGIMASLGSHAQSVVIDGVFTGYVDPGGTGTIGGLNASTVAAGTTVFGAFSYNAQIFPSGQNGFYVATGSVDTLQGINSQGNNTGSLYFSINHAWAGPVTVRAPEIDHASAVSSLALLLGGLAVLSGRRGRRV
jgi:hypothetical protein